MIRHLLLDADGVVQQGVDSFVELLLAELGEDAIAFLSDTFRPDGPVLRGEGEAQPILAARLREVGRTADAARLYEQCWLSIDVNMSTLELAQAIRATGVGVHLATNQDPERAAYMQSKLGYDEWFDLAFYSCDLGWAKPSADYFEAILTSLGVAPAEVLFIDDSSTNVAGALTVGLRAEQWEVGRGIDELIGLLAAHGLQLAR